MVYVYSKLSEINYYIGKNLELEEIKQALLDLGMDIKDETDIGNDKELKIEITAEKMDMVSTIGIARAIKYYKELETKIPKYQIEYGGLNLFVKKEAKESRPKTVAAMLKDVPMTDEFLEEMIKIQEKIHDSFGRGRKKVAIGIYPMDKIEFPITYTSKLPEEIIFTPLGYNSPLDGNQILKMHETGKKYSHLLDDFKKYPVFYDNKDRVLSMPPIINSQETGKVERVHKDLFVECSGYNLKHLDNVLKVLVTSFIDMGAKAEAIDVVYEDDNFTYRLNLDPYTENIGLDYIKKLIGIDISAKEIEKYCNKMMFELKDFNQDILTLEIPCFKTDIWHENDIADDIARGYGYNNIEPVVPKISSVGELSKRSLFCENIINTLTGMGFLELYTYMLTSKKIQLENMLIETDNTSYVELTDSKEQGLNMLRINVLPEILTSLNINRKNKYPQKVFESGFTIQPDSLAETKAINQLHLAVAIADIKANYTDVKNVLDTLFYLNQINFVLKDCNHKFMIEGRQADIFVYDEHIGFIGELNPLVLNNFGILVPVSVLEINTEKLMDLLKITK